MPRYSDAMRDLQTETAVAVAFAFGRTVEMDVAARPHGLLCALGDELAARGVLPDLLARMDPGYARSIFTAMTLDRGAARKGNRQYRRNEST